MDVQAFGHGDQGPDDLFAVFIKVAHEDHIQLDFIKAVFLQGVQAGSPDSEVVHQDLEAILVELVDGPLDLDRVLGQDGFRNLHTQHFPRNIIPLGQVHQNLVGVGRHKVGPRQVEGHRHHRLALSHPPFDQFGCFLKDVHVQLVGQVGVFQNWHEAARRHKAAFLIIPAGQSFQARQLAIHQVHLRLEEDLNVSVLDGVINVVNDELGVFSFFAEFRRVDLVALLGAFLDLIAGRLGIVVFSINRLGTV